MSCHGLDRISKVSILLRRVEVDFHGEVGELSCVVCMSCMVLDLFVCLVK